MAKQKARPAPEADAPETSGEYTVVARRYRPQQFADLVGQEPVAQALKNAIESDRVAHAYLFTGARGTGKTSTARILAKALNCVKGPTPTPCDECDICKSITSGEDIDVLEIDGASNRGIDDVRELRQNVNTRPSRSRFKIYIIDEVHMLTRESFNALLKTLEEPPAHVKFIFATTEVQKIPITILSRCQRFDFTGIASAKIAERLKQIVAAEKREADDDALMIVARRAGGSMRDSQSLLDQLLAFTGDKLTVEKVHQLLGTATDDRVLTLVESIVAKDAKRAVELLGKCAEEGLQLGELLDQLVEYWRGLMLFSCAGKESADVALTGAHRDKAFQHAESSSIDSILAGLDVLTTAKTRLRGSNYGLVLLEMTVLRLIRLDELVPVAQLSQWLSQPGTAPTSAGSSPIAIKPLVPADPAKKNSIPNPEAGSNGKSQLNGALPSVPSGSMSVADLWSRVLEKVGPMLAANLGVAGIPAIFGPNGLVLRFSLAYTSQHDFCSDSASTQKVAETLQAISGQKWNFRIETESTAQSGGKAPLTEDLANKKVTHREREQELLRIPLLNQAVEKLGARLLKADDGFGSAPESETTDLQES
jgi:DNA polymerase-3 subunit gamma/tau